MTPDDIEYLEDCERKGYHTTNDRRWFHAKVRALSAQLEDAPPPADAELLAKANRALMERVERLERVIDLSCAASVKDCGTCDEWCREGPGLTSGCVVAHRADAALAGGSQ